MKRINVNEKKQVVSFSFLFPSFFLFFLFFLCQAKGARRAKKETKKFVIDCGEPGTDNMVDLDAFTLFLQQRIKVNGKTGNLGSAIAVERQDNDIHITANIPFSKRYLKYLTKQYLTRQRKLTSRDELKSETITIREWLRVVATSPSTYELRYINVNSGDDEDDGDDEA